MDSTILNIEKILEGGGKPIIWIALYIIIGISFLVLFGFMSNEGSQIKQWIWGAYAVSVLLFFISSGLAIKGHPMFAMFFATMMGVVVWTSYNWSFGAKNITFENNKLLLFGTLGCGIVSGLLMTFSLHKMVPKSLI